VSIFIVLPETVFDICRTLKVAMQCRIRAFVVCAGVRYCCGWWCVCVSNVTYEYGLIGSCSNGGV